MPVAVAAAWQVAMSVMIVAPEHWSLERVNSEASTCKHVIIRQE